MIKSKILLHSLIILIIFLLDRFTKLYVIDLADNLTDLYISLTSYLNIILVWNSGIGFGLLQFDKAAIYNIITILIFLINLVIIYFLFNAENLHKVFFKYKDVFGERNYNMYENYFKQFIEA